MKQHTICKCKYKYNERTRVRIINSECPIHGCTCHEDDVPCHHCWQRMYSQYEDMEEP